MGRIPTEEIDPQASKAHPSKPTTGKLMSEIILDGYAHTVDVSLLDLARFTEGR